MKYTKAQKRVIDEMGKTKSPIELSNGMATLNGETVNFKLFSNLVKIGAIVKDMTNSKITYWGK